MDTIELSMPDGSQAVVNWDLTLEDFVDYLDKNAMAKAKAALKGKV